MKNLIPFIKFSLLFVLLVFLGQLALFFFYPSFYLSSVNQSQIPGFIKLTFVKYFVLILLLYLLWAFAMGALNGLIVLSSQGSVEKGWRGAILNFSLCLLQFTAMFLLVSFVYPSILSFFPLLDRLALKWNYLVLASLLLLSWLAACHFSRPPKWKKIPAYSTAALLPVLFFLWLMAPARLDLPMASPRNAGAPDILIVGFDALDGGSGSESIENSGLNLGARVYTNAFTPLPLTHPAWNSILSGLYPKTHRVRFFFESPLLNPHPDNFLPLTLKRSAGYHTLFAFDQPETSYFLDREGFDDSVFSKIGWEAHLRSILVNHFIFPALWLNNAWAEALVGQTMNSPSLFNFDLPRFFNFSFQRLAALPGESKFMALHTCHLHTPIRLSFRELKVLPRYLDLSPKEFSYWSWPKPGDPQVTTPPGWVNPYFIRRPHSLSFLRDFLKELQGKGYLATSVVALLSDHGERFLEGHEIYGGIHGVDIKTREQNNVLFTLFDPRWKELQKIPTPVSLIDLAPTLLTLAGLPLTAPYDGLPLLTEQAEPREIPARSLWTESMGFVQVEEGRTDFPQISVETLEESLAYQKNGRVRVGEHYYQRILEKKEYADLSKEFPAEGREPYSP